MTTLVDTPNLPASTHAVPNVAVAATSGSADAELRVLLRPATAGRRIERFVDGGWWPRTRDLTVELGPLLAAVEEAGYSRVLRVSYNIAEWDPAPRRLVLDGRMVKLGAFTTQAPASITLSGSSGWHNIDIAVVPPDATADIARRALEIAAREGDLHRAEEIIQLASAPAPTDRAEGQTPALESWGTDGGRTGSS